MKAKEFDKHFDEGGDITPYLDTKNAKRPNREVQRVNIDFPIAMLSAIDKEAKTLGVSRQSLLKVWINECLKKQNA